MAKRQAPLMQERNYTIHAIIKLLLNVLAYVNLVIELR